MKKLFVLLSCLILLFGLATLTSAASATGAFEGLPTELREGESAEIFLSIDGSPKASSVYVELSVEEGLEYVPDSAGWEIVGGLPDFNDEKMHGTIMPNEKMLSGRIFHFTVKGKTASATARNITLTITLHNSAVAGYEETVTVTKAVKVVCATHSYGDYAKKDDSSHTRTCTVCGSVETTAHSWDSGRVTKAASCKEAGEKLYTCTAGSCGATKTETIPKTENHTFGDWTRAKDPTCTAKGQDTRSCSVCGKVETKDVAATGHSYGDWSVSKESTCEGKGERSRTCSTCGAKDTRTTAAKGHSYGAPVVVTPATETAPGKQTRTCTVCGKTVEEEIPMLAPSTTEPVESETAQETESQETSQETSSHETSQETSSHETSQETSSHETSQETSSPTESQVTATPGEGTSAPAESQAPTGTEPAGNAGESSGNGGSRGPGSAWLWVLLAVVCLGGGGFLLFFLLKKKKKEDGAAK